MYLKFVLKGIICVLLVLLVVSLYTPRKHESFMQNDPYPLNASHEWADTDYEPVVGADENARIQWHHVDHRGMFNLQTNETNTYSNDGIYAKPMGSFIAQPPSRPEPLALRHCRPLNWHCQRPWMQCSGPVHQPYFGRKAQKNSSRKAKENRRGFDS